MAKLNLLTTFRAFGLNLNKTVRNISKDNNQVDFSKEEILLSRLKKKLGKPKAELEKMISKNLMDLLTMVPFDTEKR